MRYFRVVDDMDLGNERRFSPSLTAVGGRLKQDALLSILTDERLHVRRDFMEVGDSMVLTPDDEAVLIRTFMNEVGPRSIAVGYPESVHVAFDTNSVRLAKVWRGGFFDAKGTWDGRAGQFFDPYGVEIIAMPPGPALAFLASIEDPWPSESMTDRAVGGDFLGYRLDEKQQPIFMYRFEGVVVEEASGARPTSCR